MGSLYTALASFLDSRAHHGKWLLRIDDLDTPRNVKGSAEHILRTLESLALCWDGHVVYQSHHRSIYEDILSDLTRNQLVYRCRCSRKQLSMLSAHSDIYPGVCRDQFVTETEPHALRIKTEDRVIAFDDQLQGATCQNMASHHGDFILKRKDQIIAYQFAVVIDDHLQAITDVVRGCDLLDSTLKQVFLQQQLGFVTPQYSHVPVIVDQQGFKLSKQTHAKAVDTEQPGAILFYLLTLLKQNPPYDLQQASVQEVLNWAQQHWNIGRLKNRSQVDMDGGQSYV